MINNVIGFSYFTDVLFPGDGAAAATEMGGFGGHERTPLSRTMEPLTTSSAMSRWKWS